MACFGKKQVKNGFPSKQDFLKATRARLTDAVKNDDSPRSNTGAIIDSPGVP
jgi:hypothetical protein